MRNLWRRFLQWRAPYPDKAVYSRGLLLGQAKTWHPLDPPRKVGPRRVYLEITECWIDECDIMPAIAELKALTRTPAPKWYVPPGNIPFGNPDDLEWRRAVNRRDP